MLQLLQTTNCRSSTWSKCIHYPRIWPCSPSCLFLKRLYLTIRYVGKVLLHTCLWRVCFPDHIKYSSADAGEILVHGDSGVKTTWPISDSLVIAENIQRMAWHHLWGLFFRSERFQPVVSVSYLACCSPLRVDLSGVFPAPLAHSLLGECSNLPSAESFLALCSCFLY